jgi:hypothetical protein
MSKKIKTYSWIHDLNKAAIESQLLSEAKMYTSSVMLNETFNLPDPAYPDLKFQPGDYRAITQRIASLGDERANEARRSAQLGRLSGISPVLVKPVGDAEAEKRQHDTHAEMIDPFEDDDYAEEAALAAEIRREALGNRQARWEAEDMAAEQDMQDREDANLWSGPSGRSGEMNPMNQKINGFLRR